MAKGGKSNSKASSGANLGFEAQLWKAADALRSNMDAAEYKHVVLGLIFLKYISDAFEEQHARLEADRASGADPEDPDEYRALNISGSRPRPAASTSAARLRTPRSAKSSTTRCSPSSATTPASRASSPRTTPTRGWPAAAEVCAACGNRVRQTWQSSPTQVLGGLWNSWRTV